MTTLIDLLNKVKEGLSTRKLVVEVDSITESYSNKDYYIFVTKLKLDGKFFEMYTKTSFSIEDCLCASRILNDLEYFYNGNPDTKDRWTKEISVNKVCNSKCPLCGFSGEDLIFKFYCSNG